MPRLIEGRLVPGDIYLQHFFWIVLCKILMAKGLPARGIERPGQNIEL